MDDKIGLELGFAKPILDLFESIEDNFAYTPAQVAALLNFSQQTITEACRDKRLHSIQTRPRGHHKIYGQFIKKFMIDNMRYPSFQERFKPPE